MGQDAGSRLGLVQLAKWLRRLLNQPGACRAVVEVHRDAGGASSPRDLSGGVPALTQQVRDRVGRAVCLGLSGGLSKPLRGKLDGDSFPRCAARPWAIEYNRFAV